MTRTSRTVPLMTRTASPANAPRVEPVTLRAAYTPPTDTYSPPVCASFLVNAKHGTASVVHMNTSNSPSRGTPATPAPAREFSMRFTSTPRGARLARRLVSHRLDDWGHPVRRRRPTRR